MKAADIVFEGVVMPKRTPSAKLAARGIMNTDELGNFLTAIFSDTLNGKITLPTPSSSTRVPSKLAERPWGEIQARIAHKDRRNEINP